MTICEGNVYDIIRLKQLFWEGGFPLNAIILVFRYLFYIIQRCIN